MTEGGDAAAPERPNLLFVLVDQWRGQALGLTGEERVQTPHIDALAQESLVFTEAVSNYPVCSPYRAMLMTGQYPFRNRVHSNCNSRSAPYGCELPKDARCWSDVLVEAGYSLGYIGKWHLEAPRKPFVESYNNRPNFAWNEWTPPDRRHGFSFWHAYNTFDRHLAPEYWETGMSRDERLRVKRWGPEHEADVAIRYLRNDGGRLRDPERPFALVVSMNPPHMPYRQVPRRYVERYAAYSDEELLGQRPDLEPADSRWGRYTRRNLRYQYAMMTGVDEQLGRILEALREQGLERNTLVVFSSDHGDCLGLHGKVSKNNHYELSMRVPLILRWPRRLPARREDLLISTPDLHPTLLGLMGMGARVPAEVEGRDFAELLLTGRGERPRAQLYMWAPPEDPGKGRRGVRTERY
ncbi:MAG: sulfatase, partial [Planctomycetota bacterium]